ncbi:MAG: MDR family oxidoreductase [Thermoanaerobaculia bacterium]|nr:MDR family oxidoreductase [Thermoanaerobaculia bacterium]
MPRALMIDRADDGVTDASVREIELESLPEGDTLVEVLYSSLNYKDGLAITGKGKVVRGEYPFVPGIDLFGRVVQTTSASFAPGDPVIQNGWGMGEASWGGFSTHVRTKGDRLIPAPSGLELRDAAILGTAGYTAMLATMALEDHEIDRHGEVVVTGASGGVGSVAVHILAQLGYDVVASTGKTAAHDYLKRLGAAEIEDRETLSSGPARPLESGRWAGGIDNVGGATLGALIARTAPHGTIAACGNAGGFQLETTVLPFILRGVTLAGIDSNTCPNERREVAWKRLATIVTPEALESIDAGTVSLEELPEAAEKITRGEIQGRLVVKPE